MSGLNETLDIFLLSSLPQEPSSPSRTPHIINTLIICSNREPAELSEFQELSVQLCLITSILCFLVQLCVYGFVPKLRNLPGKCLMSLSISLLCTMLNFLLSFYVPVSRSIPCVSLAIFRHYMILVSFFWMSVLAFDAHNTFQKPFSRFNQFNSWPFGQQQQRTTFIKYSVFCWLTPALLVAVSLVAEFAVADSVIKPHYGATVCGISQCSAMLVFLLLPVAFILTVNLILFILTMRKLNLISNETELVNKSSVLERVVWCAKLAIFLGVAWIFHFVVIFAWNSEIQYFSSLFLSSQGIFILFITTIKKSVFELIQRRLNYLSKGSKHSVSSRTINTNASVKTIS